MGTYSFFIKATGNCRIMIEKLRKRLLDITNVSNYGRTHQILDLTISKSTPHRDENGEEFITLKEMGEVFNETKCMGYFDFDTVLGFYHVYESMRINGMQCYESKIKPEKATRYEWFDLLHKESLIIDGDIKETKNFDCFDKLQDHFKKYIENPFEKVPALTISKGFYDISINTIDPPLCDEEEENLREESAKKKQKTLQSEEPCRIYYLDDDHDYYFLEFLPYGEGIKLVKATGCLWVEDINGNYDEEENKLRLLLAKIDDKAFCWTVEKLEKNYLARY